MNGENNSGSEKPRIQHHQITLPKGGGAIGGIGEKFQANAVTGTGSFSFPIPASLSRSGFEPKLALSYDSGSGNSVFGHGWSMDIPSITRKTSKGLPKYLDSQDSDTFLLSGAEDLVPVVDAYGQKLEDIVEGDTIHYYRPRIEGLYAHIRRITSSTGAVHWEATTRDNVTSIYGLDAATRISYPGNGNLTFKWLLEKTYDAKGNEVVYEYAAENMTHAPEDVSESNRTAADFSNKHILSIKYGPKAPPAEGHHFIIYFDYDGSASVPDIDISANPPTDWPARLDPFSDHRAGFEMRTYRLCRRIIVFHDFDELGTSPVPVRELILSHTQNYVASKLDSIQQQGYQQIGTSWETKTFPAVSYTYSGGVPDTQITKLDEESLRNLPQGMTGGYQFVDLEGEGLSGILAEQAGAWYYKPNDGGGKFGPLRRLDSMPSVAKTLGAPQLTDIDGDGNLELVLNGRTLRGFYTYRDGEWESFRAFQKNPSVDHSSAFMRPIDLTGDGRPDLLITEGEVFTWYESEKEIGFSAAWKVPVPTDEERGPRVIFAEPEQTIFLADMSGDGLTDIVRIRNGEVSYWPNLGYGRFGAKVRMDNCPMFDNPGRFNPRYIKLGDVDGSGTTDIFYVAGSTARYWLNQSGNSFSNPVEFNFPHVDALSQVDVTDLLGNGTSCLVWSSQLPGQGAMQLSYLKLMSEGKPHLLEQIDNNMGKVVNITYAPSTEFYLADNRDWITKLPFPVHVLKEVETLDEIGEVRHHTQYRYHHGYFDGPEREFRGFGMVETIDTKDFSAYDGSQADYYVEPVLTKTWFHNGAFLKQADISAAYRDEYFQGIDPSNPDVLTDTVIEGETSLTTEERLQAHRALKGRTLRQEVYEYDPDTAAPKITDESSGEAVPYTVAESNFTVRTVQNLGDNRHAVFRVDPRETITWHYEQNGDDPRVTHDFTVDVDDYGNVKKSCAVVYPREASGATTEQTTLHATCQVNEFIDNDMLGTASFHLLGVPQETKSFELGWNIDTSRYQDIDDVIAFVTAALQTANQQPFDETVEAGKARLLSHQRFYYWDSTQTAAAALGTVSNLGLLHHVETQIFSSGLLDVAYGDGSSGSSAVTSTHLTAAGYTEDADGNWWNPGLIQHYDTASFHLPTVTEDPFGNTVTVTYDSYKIAPVQTEDALSNTSTAEIDYRTMAPRKLTDPNLNSSEAVTDPLGMVIATSLYGTEYDETDKGDTPLAGYTVVEPPNLRHVIDNPHTYLQEATSFFFYDLNAWSDRGEPPQAIGLAREKHVSDLSSGEVSEVQKTVTYSDGFGREIQTKLWVEAGEAWVKQSDDTYAEEDVEERWLSSGRTVFNNKEKPVKQYEPFYTNTEQYQPEEFFAAYGVTPIIKYDPLLRVVKTKLPMLQREETGGENVTYHVHSKVEFTPWEVKTYDQNDTVLASEYYGIYDDLTDVEKAALDKAAAHADTPAVAHLDTLGRQYKVVVMHQNTSVPADDELTTTTTFDITGKPLTVTDPRGNVAFQYTYDMAGNTLRTVSIDAGDDRVLVNVMGNPVLSRDAKGYRIIAVYDALHRLVKKRVIGNGLDNITERLRYGENVDGATSKNLRGRLYQHYDQSGRTRVSYYDIHGQPQRTQKLLRTDYKAEADWENGADWAALLDEEAFVSRYIYDALSRVTLAVNPDGSRTRPVYHQSGRLRRVVVLGAGETEWSIYVTNITYNAKSQRELILYGNGTRTDYTYDPVTFRLTKLRTRRTSDNALLQLVTYVYDPVGNVLRARDSSHEKVFGTTGPVTPAQNYTYDALYRLTRATGRMHNSLGSEAYKTQSDFKAGSNLNDISQLSEYTRRYEYDGAGNMHTLRQLGTNPFTRYVKIAADSNRALLNTETGSTEIVATPAEIAEYFDANGNQRKLDHLASVSWNYRDNIESVVMIDRSAEGNPNDQEWYVYDASGQRTRKVTERWGSSAVTIEEKLYIDGMEIKRIRQEGQDNTLERWSLHVMDDNNRIALQHRWTNDETGTEAGSVVDPNDETTYVTKLRYQYGNHLGSASLELDTAGQIISYEEYYSYGETSFMYGSSAAEVKLKEYRYTGKERDDSTGFYYYGARYYAPWTGRWLSADPAGPVDGVNLYVYVSGNPVRLVDPEGMSEEFSDEAVTGNLVQSDGSLTALRKTGKKKNTIGHSSKGNTPNPKGQVKPQGYDPGKDKSIVQQAAAEIASAKIGFGGGHENARINASLWTLRVDFTALKNGRRVKRHFIASGDGSTSIGKQLEKHLRENGYTASDDNFMLKITISFAEGQKPSEAVKDLVDNGSNYSFECFTGLAVSMLYVQYKKHLASGGSDESFDAEFASFSASYPIKSTKDGARAEIKMPGVSRIENPTSGRLDDRLGFATVVVKDKLMPGDAVMFGVSTTETNSGEPDYVENAMFLGDLNVLAHDKANKTFSVFYIEDFVKNQAADSNKSVEEFKARSIVTGGYRNRRK